MTHIDETVTTSPIHPIRRVEGSTRRRSGFTIVELLLVLLLVTATATFSIWAYFARPEVTLENAAQVLVRDLRVAQGRADILHHSVALVFDPQGNGYWVEDGAGEASKRTHGLEQIERRFDRDAVFEGVTIQPVGLGAGERIVFEPSGSKPLSGRLVLSYGRERRTIEIDPADGKIRLAGH